MLHETGGGRGAAELQQKKGGDRLLVPFWNRFLLQQSEKVTLRLDPAALMVIGLLVSLCQIVTVSELAL
jgi:hypothetical protein